MMRQTVNQNKMGNSRGGSEVLRPWGSRGGTMENALDSQKEAKDREI